MCKQIIRWLLIGAWFLTASSQAEVLRNNDNHKLVNASQEQIRCTAIPILALGTMTLVEKIIEVSVVGAAAVYTGWIVFKEWRDQKRRKRLEPEQSTSYFPDPPKHDPDKPRYTFRHGKYENAPYHKTRQSGRKSPAPKDGQRALDNSVRAGDKNSKSMRRVGVSEGEFVVLSETSEGLYHGHVRTYQGLDRYMRDNLIDAGLVNSRGKIL